MKSVRWLPLALMAALTGCGSGHGAPGAVISQTGRIGPLRMDRSSRADVVAFAGRPDAERRGVEFDSTPYIALGYRCSPARRDDEFPVLETPKSGRHGPSCKTVFWINRRTGRLGDFYSSSGRYSESHGIRIGMPTARAEHLVRKLVYVGCEENINLGGMTIAFAGGSPRKLRSGELHLIGGHVFAFALHGGRSDIGIFDCL